MSIDPDEAHVDLPPILAVCVVSLIVGLPLKADEPRRLLPRPLV